MKFVGIASLGLTLLGMAVAGGSGFAALRSEVEHKADKEVVAILSTKVDAIYRDMQEVKQTQKEILNELRRSR